MVAGECNERVSRLRSTDGNAIKATLAIFAFLLLADCAQTTALEPQSQALDARQARIFFIRQPSILTRFGTPDIKIDGKLVGSLAVGTYVVADRAPGVHRIAVIGGLDTVGYEAEIHVAPGISHYYELGPILRINADTFTYASMGVTGQPVAGTFSMNSPFMFYSLDAAAGAASIARLKTRNH